MYFFASSAVTDRLHERQMWVIIGHMDSGTHEGVSSPDEKALASGDISRVGRSLVPPRLSEAFEVDVTGTRDFRTLGFLEGDTLE